MNPKNEWLESLRRDMYKNEVLKNNQKKLLIELMEKENLKIGQKVMVMDEKTKWIDKIEITDFEGDFEGDLNLITIIYITDRSHVLKRITVSELLQKMSYFKEYQSNKPSKPTIPKPRNKKKKANKNSINYDEFLKEAEVGRVKWFGHPGISLGIHRLQPYNMGFLENGLYIHKNNIILSKATETFGRPEKKIEVEGKSIYSYFLKGESRYVLYKTRVNVRTQKKEAYDVISLEYFLKTASSATIDNFFSKQKEINEALVKFLDYQHLKGYIKKQKSISDDLAEKYLNTLILKDVLEKEEVFKEVERIFNVNNFLLRTPKIPFEFNEEQRYKTPFMLHILYLEQTLPVHYKMSFYRHGAEVIDLYKEAAERIKKEKLYFKTLKNLVEEKKLIVVKEAIALDFIPNVKIVSESIGKIEIKEEY